MCCGVDLGWLTSKDSLSEQGRWLYSVIPISFCFLFVDTLAGFQCCFEGLIMSFNGSKCCHSVCMFCLRYICLLLGIAYLPLCMSCYNIPSNMLCVAMKLNVCYRPQFGNHCCHEGNNNYHLVMALCFVLYLCDGSPPLRCLFSFKALLYSFANISKVSQYYVMAFWKERPSGRFVLKQI